MLSSISFWLQVTTIWVDLWKIRPALETLPNVLWGMLCYVSFSGHPNFCTSISANGFFLSTQSKHEKRQGRAQLISLYASRLKNAQKKLNSIEIAILAGLKIRVLWERIGMDLVTCNYMFSYMYLHLRKGTSHVDMKHWDKLFDIIIFKHLRNEEMLADLLLKFLVQIGAKACKIL